MNDESKRESESEPDCFQGADSVTFEPPPAEPCRTAESQKRLVLFAMFAWLGTLAISSFYPLDRPVDELTELSMIWAHTWVAAQAFVPITVTLIPLLLVAHVAPRLAGVMGVIMLAAVPAIVLLDCLTFHWIGERFLSRTLLHICLSLLPGLIRFVGVGDLFSVAGALIGIIALTGVGVMLSRRMARHWSVHRKGDITPITVVVLLVLVCGLSALPALWRLDRTLAEMRDHSIRHPLCAFCVVASRNVGAKVPEGVASIDARLRGLGLADAVHRKIQTFDDATLIRPQDSDQPLPDIVVVIIESLQHSLLTADVMPNAHRFSQEGILMQHHFSGGNASNLGIFSLVNGVESSYFPHSDSFTPLMNRLFHQAGYEIGFYGGTDDWDEFGMSTFIKPDFFDEFYTEPVDWIASDQRSIDRAARFLDRSENSDPNAPPRLAVVYLYSSHLPFASLPEEEVFQPAAKESYVSPYTKAQRQLVFNRYRNAVRSLDRMIAPLLTRERLIVVAGDHGESFMDDGTIGHGTRLSKVQNMTSAMMYLPGITPRVLDTLTTHADVLPTLIAFLGLDVQPKSLFEGIDLVLADDEALQRRTLGTFHYMFPEVLLVGPWTSARQRPFGYRAAFSTGQWQLAPLNPVEASGLEWNGDAAERTRLDRELNRWLVDRFAVNPLQEEISQVNLFRRYLRHEDPDIRFQAVEIAELVNEPDERLIGLLSEAVADVSPKVRNRARDVLIKLQKRRRR